MSLKNLERIRRYQTSIDLKKKQLEEVEKLLNYQEKRYDIDNDFLCTKLLHTSRKRVRLMHEIQVLQSVLHNLQSATV